MNHQDRLRLIVKRARLLARAEGKPGDLTKQERIEVGRLLESGADPHDLAQEYGTSVRRIRRVRVNRLVAAGLQTCELSKWQRASLKNL